MRRRFCCPATRILVCVAGISRGNYFYRWKLGTHGANRLQQIIAVTAARPIYTAVKNTEFARVLSPEWFARLA
jgi:poly-D-alanine transfer protein DltD